MNSLIKGWWKNPNFPEEDPNTLELKVTIKGADMLLDLVIALDAIKKDIESGKLKNTYLKEFVPTNYTYQIKGMKKIKSKNKNISNMRNLLELCNRRAI